MPRKVKCKICNVEWTTETAYCTQYKGKNFYCCSEEEFNTYKIEKDAYTEIKDILNEILGYTCTNTIIFKEIADLHVLYTYLEILQCFRFNKDYIKNLLEKKNIEKEFSKIRYIFTIIQNTMQDVKDTIKENQKQKEKTYNESEFDTLNNDYKFKNRDNINFLNYI